MTSLLEWYARFDRAELAAAVVLALTVFAGAAVPLGATLRYSPRDIESGRVVLTPPCPYRARTGRPCPLCGITRGVSAMNRLRLGQAWTYNPWSVPIWAGLWLALGGALLLGGTSARRLAGRERPALQR